MTYFQILLISFLSVFLLSFEKRIFYFSLWKKVLLSSIIVSFPFLIWDYFFTKIEIWGFNFQKTLGVYILNLPIEEILFFYIIPFCTMFIFSIISKYKLYKIVKNELIIIKLISYACIFIAIYNYEKTYTFFSLLTFGATGIFISRLKNNLRKSIYLLCLVSLIPFGVVNGILTSGIVWYDDAYNLGIRFVTIPIEDFFFSFTLLSLNAVVLSKVAKLDF